MSDLQQNPPIEQQYLELYDQEMPKVYRHVASRVSTRASAEDITSEAFMRTWDYLRQGGTIANLRAFVYRVADNLVIDYYRSKKRTEVPLDDLPDTRADRGEHDTMLNADVALLQVHLSGLPPDYAAILTHRFVEDMDVKDIARVTGKTSAHVYVIIHRAIKLLRKKLD